MLPEATGGWRAWQSSSRDMATKCDGAKVFSSKTDRYVQQLLPCKENLYSTVM